MRFAVKLRTPVSLAITLTLASTAQSPQKPDAATVAWWAQTVALSNDSMEGRDTGTQAYERAAKYVADQFKSESLKPAGDNGTFLQKVDFVGVHTLPGTTASLAPAHGAAMDLKLGDRKSVV